MASMTTKRTRRPKRLIGLKIGFLPILFTSITARRHLPLGIPTILAIGDSSSQTDHRDIGLNSNSDSRNPSSARSTPAERVVPFVNECQIHASRLETELVLSS